MIPITKRSFIIERIQKKAVDIKKHNSIFHKFGNQPKSLANIAKQNGLSYLGFGRYGGDDGKVSHIVKNNKLVPVAAKPDDVMKGAVKYDETHVNKDLDDFHKNIKSGKPPKHEKDVEDTLNRYYHDGGKFAAINDYLSSKKDDVIDKRMHKRVKKLDNLVNQSRLEDDAVIYTGTKEEIKEKGIYHSKAFRAGSRNPKHVYGASKDVIELHVSKGKPAFHVSKDEVLLPRGMKMRITGDPIHTKTNRIWKADIVNI